MLAGSLLLVTLFANLLGQSLLTRQGRKQESWSAPSTARLYVEFFAFYFTKQSFFKPLGHQQQDKAQKLIAVTLKNNYKSSGKVAEKFVFKFWQVNK